MSEGNGVAEALPQGVADASKIFVDISPERSVASLPPRPKGWRYVAQLALTGLPLTLADLCAIGGSLLIGGLLVGALQPHFPAIFLARQLLAISFVTAVVFPLFGLFPGVGLHPIVEFRQSVIAATVTYAVMLIARSAVGEWHTYKLWLLLLGWCLSLVMAPLARHVMRRICSRRLWWGQPLLVIGDSDHATSVFQEFCDHPQLGLRPVGIVGDIHEHWGDTSAREGSAREDAYLGPPQDLPEIAAKHRAFWAVITADYVSPGTINSVMSAVPNVLLLSEEQGLPSLWNRTQECLGRSCIQVQERLLLPVPRFLKRMLDLVLVTIAGAALSPLLIALCLLTKCTSRGPIFYKQKRIGHDGKIFSMWKFRSMVENADEVLEHYLENHPELREQWFRDHKLTSDPRATRLGAFMRKWSLDELPQLWNVLCGEMSLVGPRPIVDSEEGHAYIRDHPNEFEHYIRVVPGITGLWQVSGRNLTTYQERIRLDSYYVRNWSPWLDLYILLKTFRVVILCQGAY